MASFVLDRLLLVTCLQVPIARLATTDRPQARHIMHPTSVGTVSLTCYCDLQSESQTSGTEEPPGRRFYRCVAMPSKVVPSKFAELPLLHML